MQERIIRWKKWVDPFKELYENFEEQEEDEEDPPYRDSYEQAEERMAAPKIPSGPVLVGPLGIIPLTENNIPSKSFRFYMGYTNFDITNEVISVIENAQGVETLDCVTRYRFRVSIGKLFNAKSVLKSISNALCGKNIVVDKKVDIKYIQSHLNKTYPFWAIFIQPSGELEVAGSQDKILIEDRVNNAKGCEVIKSWREDS